MTKVITYGTYDLLHHGHIRLLERAKALGDYLIVGVTADDFDINRGKINVQQSLIERIEAVRNTGIADEIIVEEYDGQKIDDILRHDVDIFTVGSDWEGKFDYLNEYCKVIYLSRTQGISSSSIREQTNELRLGVVGVNRVLKKFVDECKFVNGIKISGYYSRNKELVLDGIPRLESFDQLLDVCDAVYIQSLPARHYEQIKTALICGKHVLYQSPITQKRYEAEDLYKIASDMDLVLMDGIKTAYSTAFSRMILLIKSGKIGEVVSIDATCTSLSPLDVRDLDQLDITWNSICAWGPTAMLPVFKLLGTEYTKKDFISRIYPGTSGFDMFTQVNFVYPSSTATIRIGNGVKAEGDMVIAGTKGYVYVPAPWWKLDYFECRYENPADNKRYFYQLDGEGIRYMIVSFVKAIAGSKTSQISPKISIEIAGMIEDFNDCKNLSTI